MNSASGKVIDVNLSSLLSLKAELLRKQSEVNKTKLTRSGTEEYAAHKSLNGSGTAHIDSTSKRDKKKECIKEISKDETATVYEHEDSALLEKSKRVLQAKSKFYESMTRTGGKLNSDDNCLVLFNRKRQEDQPIEADDARDESVERRKSRDSESDSSYAGDAGSGDDNDWVEYTDCLGRTRKCLRDDLENAKKRDADLAASMPERLDQSKANWMMDTKGAEMNDDDDDNDDLPIGPLPPSSIYSDGCSFISKHEEQRINWERKERENLEKVDVHYQDVFFDEARQHGVGYYAFSTDEEERRRQQHQLDEARLETIEEQERRDKQRAHREKIIAQRVIAAKNRQRARMGQPPLDEEKELKRMEEEKLKEMKKIMKEEKREEKLRKRAEAIEKERESERQQHLRPWDEGKDNAPKGKTKENEEETEWSYKSERLPLSQEEWNERKRDERVKEFAPAYETAKLDKLPKRSNFTTMPPPAAPPNYQMVPPPALPKTEEDGINFASFQSSKRQKHFQRRNYTADLEQNVDADCRVGGATIAPPENLDAYLPPQKKKPKNNDDLERSIEAGLRFLRNNSDKGTLSTKDSWTAKADY